MIMTQQTFDHIKFDPNVPVEKIYADPAFNCRGLLDATRLMELADSISLHGLQLPIMIQPLDLPDPFKYRIISGHRRFSACTKFLHWVTIPALINLQPMSDNDAKFLNLVENINRQDLTQLEAAYILQNFIQSGYSVHELASKINKSVGWIQSQLSILSLSPVIQTTVIKKRLSVDDIDYLASLPESSQEQGLQFLLSRKRKYQKKSKKLQQRPKLADLRHMMHFLMDCNCDIAARTLAWALGLVPTDVFKNEARAATK